MARRERHKQDTLSQTLDKVRRMLGASPLSSIYDKVEEVVLVLHQDLQRGLVSQDVAIWLSDSITNMLDHLPQSFGERFCFDAGMIVALSEEWSQRFPNTVERWLLKCALIASRRMPMMIG